MEGPVDQQRLRELASQREESWAFVCFRHKTGANEITENPHSARKKKKRAEECAECGKVSRHSCGIRKGVKTLVSSVEKLQWPIGRKRSTREVLL